MNTITSIKNGFIRIRSFMKYILFMYAITLLIGLVFGLAFNVSLSSFKDRSILESLFAKFDFSVFSSFMYNHGQGIDAIFSTLFVFTFLFIAIEIFFSAALVGTIFDGANKNKISRYFSRGAKYYWRFLKLFVYFIIALTVAFGIIVTLSSVIMSSFDENGIESNYFYTFLVTVVIFALAFIKLSLFADFTKLFIVKENSKNVWMMIKKSFMFLLRRMHKVFLFYIIALLILGASIGIYLLIENYIITTNMFAVFVLFIIQQTIVWLRFAIKVFLVSVEYEYFNLELQPIKIKPVDKK